MALKIRQNPDVLELQVVLEVQENQDHPLDQPFLLLQLVPEVLYLLSFLGDLCAL